VTPLDQGHERLVGVIAEKLGGEFGGLGGLRAVSQTVHDGHQSALI
jgi:hypothetical protein